MDGPPAAGRYTGRFASGNELNRTVRDEFQRVAERSLL